MISKSKLENLLAILERDTKVLVRAPPGSGKTSMAQLFGAYCIDLGHPVYSVTFAAFKEIQKDSVNDFFREYWNEDGLRTSLTAIMERAFKLPAGAKKPILIVDEGQAWYVSKAKAESGFWAAMNTKSANLLFLCFSAFGDSSNTANVGTPLDFNSYLSFPLLGLCLDDTQEVARRVFNSRTHAPPRFQRTLKQLHRHTKGHP